MPSIESSLPEDSCVLQWDRNAVAVRYHSRRVVRGCGGRRHRGAVNVAARLAGQLANALHLLPRWSAAADSIGLELYPHCRGIEVAALQAFGNFASPPASLLLIRSRTEPGTKWATRHFGELNVTTDGDQHVFDVQVSAARRRPWVRFWPT